MEQFKSAHFKSPKFITEKGVLQLRFLFLAIQFTSVNRSWCLSRGSCAQALKAAIVSPPISGSGTEGHATEMEMNGKQKLFNSLMCKENDGFNFI